MLVGFVVMLRSGFKRILLLLSLGEVVNVFRSYLKCIWTVFLELQFSTP